MVLCSPYSLPSDVGGHRAVRIGKFPLMKCPGKPASSQALRQGGSIYSMQRLSLAFQTLHVEVKKTLAATWSGPYPQRCREFRRGPRNAGKDGMILAAAVTALGWKDSRAYAVSPGRRACPRLGDSVASGWLGDKRPPAPSPPPPRLLPPRRPPPRSAPPARPSALPERQREFPAGSAAGRGQGRRLRRPVPGGCPRRWGGREGGGKSARSRAAARRVTWRGAEGPPAAQHDEEEAPPALLRWAPGGPWPSARCFLSPVSASSPRRPPGWSGGSGHSAGLGWGGAAAPGAPHPRSAGLPRGAVPGPATVAELPLERREGLRGSRLQPVRGAAGCRLCCCCWVTGLFLAREGVSVTAKWKKFASPASAARVAVLVGKGGAAFVAFGFEGDRDVLNLGRGRGTAAGRPQECRWAPGKRGLVLAALGELVLGAAPECRRLI